MRSHLGNRPLYDTTKDSELFVPPGSWEALFRWVHQGYNTLITGPHGSGRTTLLRQLQRRLRESDTRVAFVDANRAESVGHLVALITDALVGQPSAADVLARRLDQMRILIGGSSAPDATNTTMQDVVDGWSEGEAQVVLVDAPGAGQAVYDLFGRLRDQLWQLEIVWVVAVDDADAATVMRPPADAFFDQHIRAGEWSGEDLVEMLVRRGVEGPTATKVASAANGSPRRALALAREASTGDVQERIQRERRLSGAADLSDTHMQMQQAVEELGAVSASDPALLSRVAVSRPRAQALLSDLAAHGLLVTEGEQPNGRGRPRKLFRPLAAQ